jgi:hypothetical protein
MQKSLKSNRPNPATDRRDCTPCPSGIYPRSGNLTSENQLMYYARSKNEGKKSNYHFNRCRKGILIKSNTYS